MIEEVARGVGYTLAAMSLIAAAFWYGWELRTRLALKLEYFRIGSRRWVEYDEQLRANKGNAPLRAELHDIRESSER